MDLTLLRTRPGRLFRHCQRIFVECRLVKKKYIYIYSDTESFWIPIYLLKYSYARYLEAVNNLEVSRAGLSKHTYTQRFADFLSKAWWQGIKVISNSLEHNHIHKQS